MHNVNVQAIEQSVDHAREDPAGLRQHHSFAGEWQDEGPQFSASIPIPNGKPVLFEADFPGPMGGQGLAPNPLAYCFWGGLACYAMTYAQEAARAGIEVHALRARADADVDMSRALGITDNPPVERIEWRLEVEADAPRERLEELKQAADDHCPGVYCTRTAIDLTTRLA